MIIIKCFHATHEHNVGDAFHEKYFLIKFPIDGKVGAEANVGEEFVFLQRVIIVLIIIIIITIPNCTLEERHSYMTQYEISFL